MINKYAKVGDKVIYKDYEGKNTFGVIKEVAVRCGLNKYGSCNSDDDYVILEDGTELDYKDGFNANKDIETLKERNKILTKRLEEEKEFKYTHGGTFIYHDSAYEIENEIARNEVIIAALEYFETVKDSSNYMKVSDYLNLGVNAWNGDLSIRFWLSDDIEPQMYQYVWSSHSDLNTKINTIVKEMLEFVLDFKNKEWFFNRLNDKETSCYKIRENNWAQKGVQDLKEIVRFLKSNDMEQISKAIKDYLDSLVVIGKKREM